MVVIDGAALVGLLREMGVPLDGEIRKISVDKRDDGVAYKVNERMWSPTLPTETK